MDNINSKKVSDALETLAHIRDFANAKITHGITRVDLYVKDVDGEWLEKWDDDIEKSIIDDIMERHREFETSKRLKFLIKSRIAD